MIRKNDNVGDISPRQLQSIAKIARQAKNRTGKTVALQDQRFFSKLAEILQQAGEMELVQDLLDINYEISVSEDELTSPTRKITKAKLAAKPSRSSNTKTIKGFLATLLGNDRKTQNNKPNVVTVKKYQRYKIKVKFYDQLTD